MHAPNTTELLLVALLLTFSLPYAIWRLGRTDSYAPLVVVQILSGVLLGPGLLGAAFPSYYTLVFTPQVTQALGGIASWTVMIFVWVAGIELDLREAWRERSDTLLAASLALWIPFVTGSAVAALLFSLSQGWIGKEGSPLQAILGIGIGCSLTAMPLVVLFLEKLGCLRTTFGRRVLRYASIDDVVAWVALALVLLDWKRVALQLTFLFLFAPLAFLFRRLMQRLPERDRWYAGLLWLAGCGFGAERCGLHFMVGTFLSGAVLDSAWFDRKRMDSLRDLLLFAFMPVFFLSTGLRTRWELSGAWVVGAGALFLLASVAGKLGGVHLAGRILGWKKGEASVIGWLLQTKALLMVLFMTVLLDKQIITHETFTALLITAVGSTLLSIPVVQPKVRRLGIS